MQCRCYLLQFVFNSVNQAIALDTVHMKWLFRIIAFTFVVFISLCVIGAFMPAQQRVDANRVLDADVLTVYEVISDLRSYSEWTGIGGPDSEWVFGGADYGTGQTAAWNSGKDFGSIDILQTDPGQFVLLETVGPLGDQTVTLALNETETGTSFLIETNRDLGGFPYIGRVISFRQKVETKKALDVAMNGLATMVQ